MALASICKHFNSTHTAQTWQSNYRDPSVWICLRLTAHGIFEIIILMMMSKQNLKLAIWTCFPWKYITTAVAVSYAIPVQTPQFRHLWEKPPQVQIQKCKWVVTEHPGHDSSNWILNFKFCSIASSRNTSRFKLNGASQLTSSTDQIHVESSTFSDCCAKRIPELKKTKKFSFFRSVATNKPKDAKTVSKKQLQRA